MVDMGNSSGKTSQEIAAEAGTGPWTPNEYSSDPDYSEANLGAAKDVFEPDYGVESLYEAPEAAFEAFTAIFGQDADEILEGEDFGDGMGVPDNIDEASGSAEYRSETYNPMEDQSTNAVTRR